MSRKNSPSEPNIVDDHHSSSSSPIYSPNAAQARRITLSSKKAWELFQGMLIDPDLFEKGILAVATEKKFTKEALSRHNSAENSGKATIHDGDFYLGDKVFLFNDAILNTKICYDEQIETIKYRIEKLEGQLKEPALTSEAAMPNQEGLPKKDLAAEKNKAKRIKLLKQLTTELAELETPSRRQERIKREAQKATTETEKLYEKITQKELPLASISNLNRRKETFRPVILPELTPIPTHTDSDFDASNTAFEEEAIYIYPWLSRNTPVANAPYKFKKLVTAGCLIGGATLKASLSGGANATCPLIKHDIELSLNQKIDDVIFDGDLSLGGDLNVYEEALFADFKNLVRFFLLSGDDDQKEITYHLPYYDYILFGIQLVVQGKMSSAALGNLIEIILNRQQYYEAHLKDILSELGVDKKIHLIIESPFDNLFRPLDIKTFGRSISNEDDDDDGEKEDAKKTANAARFLNFLGVKPLDISSNFSEDILKEKEKQLVQLCIEKLKDPENANREQAEIWEDFYNVTKIELNKTDKKPFREIETIEELFKWANSFEIFNASKEMNNDEVCSYLSASEKQIAIEHSELLAAVNAARLKTKGEGAKPYPNVVYITVLDRVLSYAHNVKGNIFYLTEKLTVLYKLITHGILTTLARNAVAFTKRAEEQPTSLKMFLDNISRKEKLERSAKKGVSGCTSSLFTLPSTATSMPTTSRENTVYGNKCF